MSADETPLTGRDHLPRTLATLRVASVAALILLIPYNIHLDAFISQHSPHLVGSGVQSTHLGPVDAVLALLIVATLPLLIPRSGFLRQPLGQAGMAVFAVVVAVSLLIFPSVAGAMMLLRVVGAFAVVVAIRSMSRADLVVGVVWSFALGASLQALTALGQTFVWHNGMIVDATTLADGEGWTAGRGTFGGTYSLAAYVILAMATALSFGISKRPANSGFRSITLSGPARIAMWITVVTASAATATTFGRAVLIAVGLVGSTYAIGWLLKRQTVLGISALAVTVPLAATGLLLRSGWLVRLDQSAALDLTRRDDLAETALSMITMNPLIGVGPVQYGSYMTEMGLVELDRHVVHNLPLLISAEFGIVVGIAFTVWLIAVVVRSFRLSIYATGLALSMVPFLLFDNLHYVYGNGIAMFAIWIAMLDYHRDVATEPSDTLQPAHSSAR